MASEVKRGLIRIVSNYARLLTGAVAGVLLVPLLWELTGKEGWTLTALLGSTMGLAAMIQNIAGLSLMRELGTAHHSGDPHHFRTIYNAALAICATISLLVVMAFAIVWWVVPLFDIPSKLLGAGRWLIVARAVETFAVVLLAPISNMYKITERMVIHNAWIVANRLCYILTAVCLLLVANIDDAATNIQLYAVISAALRIGLLLAAVLIMTKIDSRLIPAPTMVTRHAIKSILHMGGWNALAATATNLHRRLAPIIMDLTLGFDYVTILSLAIQLTVSVRRLTTGMTDGLAIVSTRLSTLKGNAAVLRLIHHSTRLHGLATFPVAVLVLILAEPLLKMWMGDRIEDTASTIPKAMTLIHIMIIGMAARAISNGWIQIFYGAGHVARYAPVLFLGVFINPLLVFLLLSILPNAEAYTAVAWAYSAVFVTIHAGLVPLIGAKALRISAWQIFAPLLRPMTAAFAAAPIPLLINWLVDWEPMWLVLATGLYGVAYVVLAATIVMDQSERQRFTNAARRRLRLQRD